MARGAAKKSRALPLRLRLPSRGSKTTRTWTMGRADLALLWRRLLVVLLLVLLVLLVLLLVLLLLLLLLSLLLLLLWLLLLLLPLLPKLRPSTRRRAHI